MKMILTNSLVFSFGLLVGLNHLGAQNSHSSSSIQNSLPSVFILGEYDVQYESMMPNYRTLLEACDGEMEEAFEKLTSMMQEMEAYAQLADYDLKGINAWMHFFWDKNGTIEHIGFHLKPNSRNVDTDELKQFLSEFARNYRMPLTANNQFAHYSSFSFPLNFHSKMQGTVRNKE